MDNASEIFEAVAGSTSVDPNTLEKLSALADEALALEELTAQLEEDLKVANSALNALKSRTIPDLMAELGMESFTRNGQTLGIYEFVSGSLPKDEEKRKRAIAWLESNGGGGLIKTEISMSFGKDDRDQAVQTYKMLKQAGADPKAETGVHASTLQAFARERLKNGEQIDTEMLGLYTGRVVKIKEAKKGKK